MEKAAPTNNPGGRIFIHLRATSQFNFNSPMSSAADDTFRSLYSFPPDLARTPLIRGKDAEMDTGDTI